jgi:hypothetical protein
MRVAVLGSGMVAQMIVTRFLELGKDVRMDSSNARPRGTTGGHPEVRFPVSMRPSSGRRFEPRWLHRRDSPSFLSLGDEGGRALLS